MALRHYDIEDIALVKSAPRSWSEQEYAFFGRAEWWFCVKKRHPSHILAAFHASVRRARDAYRDNNRPVPWTNEYERAVLPVVVAATEPSPPVDPPPPVEDPRWGEITPGYHEDVRAVLSFLDQCGQASAKEIVDAMESGRNTPEPRTRNVLSQMAKVNFVVRPSMGMYVRAPSE